MTLAQALATKGTRLTSLRPNLVLRSRVFHFRRAVPLDLRPRFGRRELSISLRTSDAALARVWSRELYVASERLFAEARQNSMLTANQIATIAQDFYQYVLDQENQGRLTAGRISEERRAARAGYYKEIAEKCPGAPSPAMTWAGFIC